MHFSRTTKILLVSVGAFVALTVGGAFAYDSAHQDEIAPGVRIAGVDVGGHSIADARPLLKKTVVEPLMQPVQVRFEGKDLELTPKALGLRTDVDAMLQEAVDASRQGGLPQRLVRYATSGEVSTDLAPKLSYSEKELGAAVDRVADRIDRPAIDASLTPTGDSITPTEGKDGIEVDRDRLQADVTEALQQGNGDRTVTPHVTSTEPEISTDELATKYPTYITIDRANFKLTLWKNLKVKKAYSIAVGQQGLETPAGTYTINDKQIDPTWHVPNSDWAGALAGQSIPPGPGNPLLERWMGFYSGAGIHGTSEPSSIGSAASHGCVRMRVDEVIDLYDRVPLGTPIYIG